MTVTSVTEMWSRRNPQYESSDGRLTTFSLTTAYQVVHDADDSDDTILLDSNLPRVTDVLPGKPGVICRRVRVASRGLIFSVVEAEWSGDANTDSGSPLALPVDWVWSSTATSEPVDTDAEGIPLCNVNGELKEGFTKEVNDFTLTVNRNFQAINTFTLSDYLDSVNSDPFGSPDSIWPIGTAALRSFVAQLAGSASEQYYKVTAVIDFRIPYRTIPLRAWWYRYRNDGRKIRTGTRVTFSGGGATAPATGFAVVSGGAVSSIKLTYGGRGYTSAPSVVITSDTGGSGATATATIGPGQITDPAYQRVVSVSVGSGGSGYTSRLILAADGNEETDGGIVCLKADGSLEPDPNAAVWIERRKKQFYLPYSGLGLFQ